ncbi:MAG: universal stress protein [Burkholderiales bacterium]
MFKRILVPIDGSRSSIAGLRVALSLARIHKARIRLVHLATELPRVRPNDAELLVGELYELVRKRGGELLERSIRYCRDRGVKADTALYLAIAGRASRVIVKEAKKWHADLVVMGTHGRRGIARLAMGSDAEAVARASSVPVLLVRAGKRR